MVVLLSLSGELFRCKIQSSLDTMNFRHYSVFKLCDMIYIIYMRHHSVFLNLHTTYKYKKVTKPGKQFNEIKQLFKTGILNLTLNTIDIYI